MDKNIQNENCLTTSVDHKTVFEPFLNPKNILLGPQKVNYKLFLNCGNNNILTTRVIIIQLIISHQKPPKQ